MKHAFLIYENCCLYEVVILNYFLSITQQEMVFCSLDGKPVRAIEGYSINADMALHELEEKEISSFVIPGGDISKIDTKEIHTFLAELKSNGALIAAICAGVDVLDHAGILTGIESTHSKEADLCNDNKVITARANAYVDFAIEVAKEFELFEDEADLQETIDFWKYHKYIP